MKRAFLTVILVALISVQACRSTAPTTTSLSGSLFVSDAGQAHGGFEYTASWDATLTVKGSAGTLKLVLNIGLGDALTKHEFAVTDFSKSPSQLNMKLDGQPVTLVWVEKDDVWDGQFARYYIASRGGYASASEIRGTISPKDFPGLADHYYVELRLR